MSKRILLGPDTPVDLPKLIDTRLLIQERFWAKVDRNGPIPPRRLDLGACWLWTGTSNGKSGYGLFRGGVERDKGGSKKWVLAHRYSFTLANGPIPEGMEPDHLCFTRLCVNPDHLEATTHRENTLRGDSPPAKQARRQHCLQGHPFDVVDAAGKRRCSICDRAKEERRYLKRYGRVAKPNSRRGRRAET